MTIDMKRVKKESARNKKFLFNQHLFREYQDQKYAALSELLPC